MNRESTEKAPGGTRQVNVVKDAHVVVAHTVRPDTEAVGDGFKYPNVTPEIVTVAPPLKGEFKPTASTRIEVQPYLHLNRGGGDWHAPSYGSGYSPDPIMFRQTQYKANRTGIMAKATSSFMLGGVSNQFEVGGWYEMNESSNRRPRWRMKNYQLSPEVDFTKVLRLDYDRTADVTTTQFHVQNTNRLLNERLTLSYGAKLLTVNADFTNNGNTPTAGIVAPIFADATRPSLNVKTDAGILPQVGFLQDDRQGGTGDNAGSGRAHASWQGGSRPDGVLDRLPQPPARHRTVPADRHLCHRLWQRGLGEYLRTRRRGERRSG